MKPRLLDLFCGAGGAAMGYHRAGFEVVGVDINPQPRYPFEFHRADAMDILRGAANVGADPLDGGVPAWSLMRFDAIHASPPCQAFSTMRVMGNARTHPDLLTPSRDLLLLTGLPFVIENVSGAPMESGPPSLWSALSGVVLCGSMFNLRTDEHELRRHRQFESNVPLAQPQHQHRADLQVVGFYGDHARTRTRVNGHHARGTDVTRSADKLVLVRDLMGIDWMAWTEATQAIPPAYAEWIGRQLMAAIAVAA